MLEFLKGPFLILHFFYYTLMAFLMMLSLIIIFYIIFIYADDTTLYSKCDQASDLWQQLYLASELESDLRATVELGEKWLIDFNAEKT